MLNVGMVTDDAGFAALEAEWRALHEASPEATPFQSWEWAEAWRRHHPGGRLRILVARDRDNRVVGILPLVRTFWRGTPFRQLRFLGAPLSDYQDQLARDADREHTARAFFTALVNQRGDWDVADLNDLRAGGALLAGERPSGLEGGAALHRRCPVILLPATWEAYQKTLGKNLRANVGRRRRQLEKAHRLELETVSRAEDLPGAMEDLYRLHNGRWQKRGASGAFATPALQAFHHEIARRFLARGWLRLHRLRTDGETHASFYCYSRGGRVYYYLSGFDEVLAKFSPGIVMMGYALQHAIGEGAREFDLLRGDESYKYEWKAEDRTTERLVIGHGAVRSRLGRAGHRLERFIEHEGLKLQKRLWDGRRDAERAPGKSAATLTPSDGDSASGSSKARGAEGG